MGDFKEEETRFLVCLYGGYQNIDEFDMYDKILLKKHKSLNGIIREVEWNTLRKFDGMLHPPLIQKEMNKFIKCLKYCYPLINHICLYSDKRLNGIQQWYCPCNEAVID